MVSEFWCRDCQRQLDEMSLAIDRFREANGFWEKHWERLIGNGEVVEWDGFPAKVEKLEVEMLLSAESEDDGLVVETLDYEVGGQSVELQIDPDDDDKRESAKTHLVLNENDEKSVVHVCVDCEKSFSQFKYLRKHRRAVHENSGSPLFQCQVADCNKSFKTAESLRSHTMRHGEKNLICDQCSASFHLKKDLITHWHFVHLKLLPFHCERCGRRFKDRYTLRLHSSKPSCPTSSGRYSMLSERFPEQNRRPVPPLNNRMALHCAACPRICNSPHTLEQHYRTSHPDWDYTSEVAKICPKCYRQFETAAANTLHFESVHNRWPCPICKIQLTCQEALERHMKRHPLGKERPFTCDVCQARFMTAAMLRSHHRRRHTDERPFECPDCHKRFAEQPEMRMHQRRHRIDGEPMVCADCGQEFAYAKLLRQHIVMRHSSEFEWFTCEFCGDKFVNSSMMHAHARVHHPMEFQEGGG